MKYPPPSDQIYAKTRKQHSRQQSVQIRFWVIELGAEVSAASNSAQRIKLTLDPRRAGQPRRKVVISGEDEMER
jgi:hypothetical protein